MQDRQEIKTQYTEDTIFNSICALAIAGDEQGLRQLLATNVSVARHCKEWTPVKLLAQKGEHRAVQFLLRRFDASPNHAVEGYARGGFVENVDAFLASGAIYIYAACGYAYAGNNCQLDRFIVEPDPDSLSCGFFLGHHADDLDLLVIDAAIGGQFELVEKLISMGADIGFAAWGYVLGGFDHKLADLRRRNDAIDARLITAYAKIGNFTEVENYLRQDAQVINLAVDAYAQSGYVDQVEDLIRRGADLHDAIIGYIKAGFIREADDLIARASGYPQPLHTDIIHAYASRCMLDQLKTQVQSEDDVEVIVDALDEIGHLTKQDAASPPYFILKTLVTLMSLPYAADHFSKLQYDSNLEVRSVYKLMQKYSLDFEQAYALHNNYIPLIVWILQGKNIEPALPHNIFIKLAMELTKMDYLDTEAICAAVVKNTHDGAKARIEQKYRPGLFDCITRLCRDTHREMKLKHEELSELESRYVHQGRRVKFG